MIARKLLISTVTVLITLTACAAPPPASGTTATLSLMLSGDPTELAAFHDLLKTFGEQNPGINVAITHIPSGADYRQRLASDFAAGAPPDVFLLNYHRAVPYSAKNQLEPLNDYLSNSTVIKADDFYEQALNAYRYDGALNCLPQNISSPAIYYNKALFDQAQVPYPSNEWTWSDMLSAAQKIATLKSDEGPIYGYGAEISFFRIAPFIWSNGGQIVDQQMRPTKLTLDNAAAQEAIQWYADFQTQYKVAPDAAADKSEDAPTRFVNGRLGLYMDSRRVVPTFRATIGDKFDWDVAPIPAGKTKATILHSDGYCMAVASKNKDAAWKLIEFFASPIGQTKLTQIGRLVPSHKSLAESPLFLDPNTKPKNSRIWLDAIPFIRLAPAHPEWIALEGRITKSLEGVYYGAKTVTDTTAFLDAQAAELLK
jgi:multiple sugar transport system substrate-binding protein